MCGPKPSESERIAVFSSVSTANGVSAACTGINVESTNSERVVAATRDLRKHTVWCIALAVVVPAPACNGAIFPQSDGVVDGTRDLRKHTVWRIALARLFRPQHATVPSSEVRGTGGCTRDLRKHTVWHHTGG